MKNDALVIARSKNCSQALNSSIFLTRKFLKNGPLSSESHQRQNALAIGNNGSGFDVYDFDQSDELVLGSRPEKSLVCPSLSNYRVSRMILTPLHYDEVINEYLYELEWQRIPNPGGKLGDAVTRQTAKYVKGIWKPKDSNTLLRCIFKKEMHAQRINSPILSAGTGLLRGRRIMDAQRREELLARYRASGLTQKAFARREGVNFHTLCA